VGGYDLIKGPVKDYLTIDPDSTNIYVRKINQETISTFNIIGISQEGDKQYLLIADPDTLALAGVLQIQYNIIVTTAEINSITLTSAISGGNIVSDGDATITARGVCWSTDPNPTTDNSKTNDGSGIGSFSSSITGLTPGTTYHVRAYATNLQGTAYGADVSFTTTTAPVVPTVTTTAIYTILATTANGGGKVISDGGAPITAHGLCWSSAANPSTSDSNTNDGSTGLGSFASSMTGLTQGTAYHVRAYATNSVGTAYGEDVLFATKLCVEVVTSAISSILSSTATSGGNITSNCGALVTARGICWSKTANPTIADNFTTEGSGTGTFTSSISGLSSGTIYYVRAYATTGLGTSYGNQVSFVTLSTVSDFDGNVYTVVPIGTQVWLKENLITGKLNDGSPITLVTDGTTWSVYTTPTLCYYNNDEATNKSIYGALYNWYAVNSGKLCPTGWHVPTYDEWIILITYLGGEPVAGGKLKETGTTHWTAPNAGATNETGFTALPGGFNYGSGSFWFQNIGVAGVWWSSTPVPATSYVHSLSMDYSVPSTYWMNSNKNDGISVRCLKD
jgi:uncharacterized protein (TIGR02145 family)